MRDTDKSNEKSLEEMYKSVGNGGFISVSTLKKKYAVEQIKTLEDISIPNLDKINPQKIESIQYLLLRLKNMGCDLGYNEWFRTFDFKFVLSNIKDRQKGVDEETRKLMDSLKLLLEDVEKEFSGVKVEPLYWESVRKNRNGSQNPRTLSSNEVERLERIVRQRIEGNTETPRPIVRTERDESAGLGGLVLGGLLLSFLVFMLIQAGTITPSSVSTLKVIDSGGLLTIGLSNPFNMIMFVVVAWVGISILNDIVHFLLRPSRH